MLSKIKKIIFRKIPSPYETSSLYWLDLIPFVGYFLIRHFDIHLALKAEHPFMAILMVLLLPLIFAIPVLDLWPKAYGSESEMLDDKKLEYYRRSVRKRLTLVAVVIIVVVIYGRQIKI